MLGIETIQDLGQHPDDKAFPVVRSDFHGPLLAGNNSGRINENTSEAGNGLRKRLGKGRAPGFDTKVSRMFQNFMSRHRGP